MTDVRGYPASINKPTVVAAGVNSESATDGYVLTADGSGGAAWEAASAGGGGVTVFYNTANVVISTTSGTFYYCPQPAEVRTGKTKLLLGLILSRSSGTYDVDITLRHLVNAVVTDVETKTVTGSVGGFSILYHDVEFAVPDPDTYTDGVFQFKFLEASGSTSLYGAVAILL